MFDFYLRPICSTDAPLIAKGIMDLSHESRRMRFFGDFKQAPDHLVQSLADADGVTHIAWGALDVSGLRHRPAAAVHAFRGSVSETTVELACSVMEDYQGHGLAQVLMAAVMYDCHALGITKAVAEVMAANSKAQHLFLGLGAKIVSAGHEQRLEMDVQETLALLERPGGPDATRDMLRHVRQTALN